MGLWVIITFMMANIKMLENEFQPASTDKQSGTESVEFSIIQERVSLNDSRSLDSMTKSELIRLFKRKKILRPSKYINSFTHRELAQFLSPPNIVVYEDSLVNYKKKYAKHFKKVDLYFTLQNLASSRCKILDLKNIMTKIEVKWYIAAINSLDPNHDLINYLHKTNQADKAEMTIEQLSAR